MEALYHLRGNEDNLRQYKLNPKTVSQINKLSSNNLSYDLKIKLIKDKHGFPKRPTSVLIQEVNPICEGFMLALRGKRIMTEMLATDIFPVQYSPVRAISNSYKILQA